MLNFLDLNEHKIPKNMAKLHSTFLAQNGTKQQNICRSYMLIFLAQNPKNCHKTQKNRMELRLNLTIKRAKKHIKRQSYAKFLVQNGSKHNRTELCSFFNPKRPKNTKKDGVTFDF